MKKILLVLFGILALASCASPALKQDCLARKARLDRVAALAGTELFRGMQANVVRSLLGEPVEIVTPSGVGPLEIWKYYVLDDCRAELGISSPVTELFFLKGDLWSWNISVR
jgi:hypothetical protein